MQEMLQERHIEKIRTRRSQAEKTGDKPKALSDYLGSLIIEKKERHALQSFKILHKPDPW